MFCECTKKKKSKHIQDYSTIYSRESRVHCLGICILFNFVLFFFCNLNDIFIHHYKLSDSSCRPYANYPIEIHFKHWDVFFDSDCGDIYSFYRSVCLFRTIVDSTKTVSSIPTFYYIMFSCSIISWILFFFLSRLLVDRHALETISVTIFVITILFLYEITKWFSHNTYQTDLPLLDSLR